MRIAPAREVESWGLGCLRDNALWIPDNLHGNNLYYILGDLVAAEHPYELHGDIFGFGMIRGWDEDWDEKILGIVVDERVRHKGVGTIMMQWLHWCAKRRGLDHLRLHVHSENKPALGLYTKMGYVDCGPRDNGERIMRCQLVK
jgi:ribosomal protein S18 acetylase RimI-like enzyme